MYPLLILLLLLLPQCHAQPRATAPKLLETWKRLPNYPIPVFESAGGILRAANNSYHLLVAGGYISNSGLRTTNHVYTLHLQNRFATWRRVANMPMHLTHCAQAIAGESMYLCGGFLGTAPGRSVRECFAYGITTNTWRKLPNLPRVVGGGGLVYVGQKHSLLYASGMDRVAGKFGGRDVADSYMLELGKMYKGWIKKAPLGNARNHMAAMSARGRYFFIGGQHKEDESRGNQRTVEEYDVWKNKWITKAGMPEGLGHIAASTVRYWNGIFVVGGIMNGRKLSGRILYYDPLANKWSVVGKFPRSVQSPICGVYGMRLWCTTGQGTPGTAVYGYSRKLSKPLPV